MPNPPSKTLINPSEIFASRDLRLQDRRETQYPQLKQLCVGFNFSVLQLQRKLFSHLSRKMVPGTLEFVLATHDETSNCWFSMTPGLASLKMLNDYTKRHEVDILHTHLFGDEDDDFNQFEERGLY